MIVTYGDLVRGATSSSSDERKRAFAIFQRWMKLAPTLSPDQRLSFVERDVLTKLFAQKGFNVEQPKRPTQRRA